MGQYIRRSVFRTHVLFLGILVFFLTVIFVAALIMSKDKEADIVVSQADKCRQTLGMSWCESLKTCLVWGEDCPISEEKCLSEGGNLQASIKVPYCSRKERNIGIVAGREAVCCVPFSKR